MKRQDSIGHLENEIHFQLILDGSTVNPEATPFQNGC